MLDYCACKEYLAKKGYKQKFIAQKVGVNEATLSDVLNGKRKCSLEMYVNLCSVLALPFGKFIKQQTKSAQATPA